MSQYDFGAIDPNTKSGTQLAVDLNGFRDAVISGHKGVARPTYLPAGGSWVMEVSAVRWDLMFYDGDSDYTVRSINPTTNTLIGIPTADVAGLDAAISSFTSDISLTVKKDSALTTGAAVLPSGTSAERPVAPSNGMFRYNTSLALFESYSAGSWSYSGLLDTARIDVASTTTVNLTTAAPSTAHINITGTTTVTGFTIAAGKTYFVRFAGTLTLTNNANIVTQSGANITAVAGDTCILRATAANVVEVLAYTPSINQAIGYGQTWQNLTYSRAWNTVYTNSTGKPIGVNLGGNTLTGTSFQLQVETGGGTDVYVQVSSDSVAINVASSCSAIVPNGFRYKVVAVGAPVLFFWSELR